MRRWTLPALAGLLAVSTAAPAGASPFGAVVAGPALGDETGLGGVLGARGGWREPRRGLGGFAELTGLYFLGFGPHSHIDGVHALVAGEWTHGARARGHLFGGAGLDHWARPGTDNDEELATTVVSGALGAGVSLGPVRLDLEGSVTLVELARATDSRAVGPQLYLLLSIGRP